MKNANIPPCFKVVAIDSWVWIFDDSERTYICSAQPHIYCEPLYPYPAEGEEPDEDPDYPDADYWPASYAKGAILVPGEHETMDDAREYAQGNHLI